MVNTVTLYRSPVRLVKHAAEETEAYSPAAVSRARKKLMAEIALSGEEIVIDDVPYARNDASALLDAMTEESWKVHGVIYAHNGLLRFLEREEFNDEEIRKADAHLYNERFVRAVSPYFAHSFNAVSGRLLKAGDFVELVKLQNYSGYILPEHSSEGYQKIRTYLDDLSYTLRNLSWEKFIADESILHFAFSGSWKDFINKLPSPFTTMRDEIAAQLIHIVLRFQNGATWHYLHQLLVQLRSIETNDYNRSEIERIDKVIYRNSQLESSGRVRKSSSDKGEFASGRAVWWAICIVLAIVRAATCNDRSSKNTQYSFDNTGVRQMQELQSSRIDEKRNEPLLLNFLDSLSRQPSLPIDAEEMKTGSQPFSSFADDFVHTKNGVITLANNTPYNCVMLYFEGPSHSGSVYQGALSATRAAYIKQGETVRFNKPIGNGAFYFLFGDKWGKLKKGGELPIYSGRGNSNDGGYRQLLFVYEFFNTKKPVKQTLLQRAVYIDDAGVPRNEEAYTYLNTSSSEESKTKLTLLQKGGVFSVEASGPFVVKQDRENRPDDPQKAPINFP